MTKSEPKDPETLNLRYSQEPRISDTTFCNLFDNHSEWDDFTVIDCRTSREYEGGHIKGAIRCHPFEKTNNIPELYKKIWKPRSIYIFHCEYSAYRAPASFHQFEDTHKTTENAQKPLHAFVLDGGYRDFYPKHQKYCDGGYTPEGFGMLTDYNF